MSGKSRYRKTTARPAAPGRNAAGNPEGIRRRFQVAGQVQGVGFRPFVYRLASELGLAGIAGNNTHGAFIEVEGSRSSIESFESRLPAELPPLAKITSLSSEDIPLLNESSFRITASRRAGEQDAEITPDYSVCDDCFRELFDPGDRRYRYPFINCTNCGPRYSIVQGIPYDRPNTTMGRFTMCPDCQGEYDDPSDRRFHAQPNACPVCGPAVQLTDTHGRAVEGDAMERCVELLREGKIVAIKGLGGFHLACLAENDDAVGRLRERKSREAKPFAMMVGDIRDAERIAEVDAASSQALRDMRRPIVLMPKRSIGDLSSRVAPNSDCYGIMLPYTPLHYLLFAGGLGPLVMTSGNPSEEPLCGDNEDALHRLAHIADAFLLHDRDIERRVDDSVVKVFAPVDSESSHRHEVVPVRRARGYVPTPIRVPINAREPVLAVGAELKSTVCILKGSDAVLSEHLGELANPAAYRNFTSAIECLKTLLRVEPAVIAYDMHPDYSATRYAKHLDLEGMGVQHHHAHIVSCMAENGISGEVIGISCDGTGYGLDGNIWGCEVLVCDERDFARAAHLLYYPLPGGDTAAKETWRPALGLLRETYGDGWRHEAASAFSVVEPERVELAERRLTAGRIPLTSSLGRLFDAVAFLLGICGRNRYEAEAAMALEDRANAVRAAEPLPYSMIEGDGAEAPIEIDWRPMVRGIVDGMRAHVGVEELARSFHETVAMMLSGAAHRIAGTTGKRRVVLSGGCFVNRILLERLHELLSSSGFDVFIHRSVPPGDGGIALGQAVIAAARTERGAM